MCERRLTPANDPKRTSFSFSIEASSLNKTSGLTSYEVQLGIAGWSTSAIIVLATLTRPAAGQLVTVDGNHLMNYCEALSSRDQVDDQAIKSGYCLGYLRAIANMLTSDVAVDAKDACLPTSADMDQLVVVFKHYMKDHPEKRHLPAQNLVAEAFALAFSCQRAELAALREINLAATTQAPLAYFLDELPSELTLAGLPAKQRMLSSRKCAQRKLRLHF
jgi:Rap1a immunity proteins